MIIKKYQAKTEVEALDAAQKELGQNVVLMNSRSVKQKGLFAFLRSPITEITVALEEESEKTMERSPILQNKNTLNFNTAFVNEEEVQNQKLKGSVYQPPFSNMESGVFTDNEAEKGIHKEQKESKAIEERLDNLRSLIEENLVKSDASLEDEEEKNEENESIVFMKLLYNTMIENEVDEKYANQFIDDIEKIDKPNIPLDYLLSNIYQKMVLKFGTPSMITEGKDKLKLVFFIGPTGVGKTTTIAKIASKFCVEQKKKVTLLTADTYRIAAAEQLRTYASILDIPFRVIYSVDEIQSAVRDFSEYDYILVDTAGHSHNNEQQKNTMQELLNSVDGLCEYETYLVVSATTKYRDLLNIADTYTQMTNYKLIFTKLDETTTLGNLLNLRLHTGADMSYVTCGQNVPDDIEVFQPQKTVKQLLGGKK